MRKILIVEDDPFLLKMYAKKFQVKGWEVITAKDGIEALEKMRSFLPDITLMDIMMPRLNGIDALERAKQDQQLKGIPVLVLTNLSTSEDAHTAIEKGAIGYLVKSNYTPSQIVEKVDSYLVADPAGKTNG